MAYFINASHQSVCLYMYVARQQLSKNITMATNSHATVEELLDASFSTWSMSYQRTVCGSVYHLIVFRQWLSKYSRSNKELLELFSMRSMLCQRKVGNLFFVALLVYCVAKYTESSPWFYRVGPLLESTVT
jgi:hypothetical protein